MKTKGIFLIIALVALLVSPAVHGSSGFAPGLSYDLFGTFGTKDREDFDDSQLGVGAGINYFFTEHIGVAADTYVEEIDFPDHLDLSVIGQLPLESIPVAPYVFAGFGRQWHEVAQWTGHLGIGAQYKWGKGGVFFDLREVFADKSRDLTLFRLGYRGSF